MYNSIEIKTEEELKNMTQEELADYQVDLASKSNILNREIDYYRNSIAQAEETKAKVDSITQTVMGLMLNLSIVGGIEPSLSTTGADKVGVATDVELEKSEVTEVKEVTENRVDCLFEEQGLEYVMGNVTDNKVVEEVKEVVEAPVIEQQVVTEEVQPVAMSEVQTMTMPETTVMTDVQTMAMPELPVAPMPEAQAMVMPEVTAAITDTQTMTMPEVAPMVFQPVMDQAMSQQVPQTFQSPDGRIWNSEAEYYNYLGQTTLDGTPISNNYSNVDNSQMTYPQTPSYVQPVDNGFNQ